MPPEIVVSLRGVRKDYQGLRPLRVAHFELRQGETVALVGVDRAAAEVLVNLITAATLPDAGDVDIFGASTREITDPDSWFRSLDRFGILSERVVLIDELSVGQNLALPLSLDVGDLPPDVRHRIDELAAEVGVPAEQLPQPMAGAGPVTRMRVRLGKSLALQPRVLLAEHPAALVPADEAPRLAKDLSTIAARRGLAMLVFTADTAFAADACRRILTFRPATGDLNPVSSWRKWLGR